MTWLLLVLLKYTRYTSHIFGFVHINIVIISTWNYALFSQKERIDTEQLHHIHFAWCRYWYLWIIHEMDHLYVTVRLLVHNDDRTWGLHTNYTFCILSVLLYDVCTICTIIASYEICTTILLIAQDFVFQTSIVSVWISFLRISVDIAFWVSLQLMALQLNCGCSFS